MTPHINAAKGDIAETVLMPGDPYRAKWAAETYLDSPRLVNEVRGMLGFTGTYKGNPVTIHGSGMGMPSISIYANELITQYGAKTLIRIGSCGAMQHHVKVRDVVIAMTATTLSTPSAGLSRSPATWPSRAGCGGCRPAIGQARPAGQRLPQSRWVDHTARARARTSFAAGLTRP